MVRLLKKQLRVETIVTYSDRQILDQIILKFLTEKKTMPPRSPPERSSSHESKQESADQADNLYLSHEKFDELLKATQLLQQFIKKVEEANIGGLSRNVINRYCGKYEEMDVPSATISRLLDKRIQRMFKNRKIKRNWSEQDLQILVWVVIHYANLNNIESIEDFENDDWTFVSQLIPGTTGESCMFRVLSLRKFKLSEQKWTESQSILLAQLVNKHSKVMDWKIISQDLFKKNDNPAKIFRNPKQCKEHWTCYLNPALRKGPWDVEEDIKLMEYVKRNNGKKKWADMAKVFKGRTENALKNRYALILEKDRNRDRYKDQLEKVEGALKMLRETRGISHSRENEEPNRPHHHRSDEEEEREQQILGDLIQGQDIQIFEEESREHQNSQRRERSTPGGNEREKGIYTDPSEQGTDKKEGSHTRSSGSNNFRMGGTNQQGVFPMMYSNSGSPFFMMFGGGNNHQCM